MEQSTKTSWIWFLVRSWCFIKGEQTQLCEKATKRLLPFSTGYLLDTTFFPIDLTKEQLRKDTEYRKLVRIELSSAKPEDKEYRRSDNQCSLKKQKQTKRFVLEDVCGGLTEQCLLKAHVFQYMDPLGGTLGRSSGIFRK